jgi:hypothetical protein
MCKHKYQPLGKGKSGCRAKQTLYHLRDNSTTYFFGFAHTKARRQKNVASALSSIFVGSHYWIEARNTFHFEFAICPTLQLNIAKFDWKRLQNLRSKNGPTKPVPQT